MSPDKSEAFEDLTMILVLKLTCFEVHHIQATFFWVCLRNLYQKNCPSEYQELPKNLQDIAELVHLYCYSISSNFNIF